MVERAAAEKAHADMLARLVAILMENDPDCPVADNGAKVIDLWRDDAKHALAAHAKRREG